jgi:hypothetical protein
MAARSLATTVATAARRRRRRSSSRVLDRVLGPDGVGGYL